MATALPATFEAVPRRTDAGNQQPANAFTVDVEEWFQVGAFETTLSRSEWPDLESRVALQTRAIIGLLQEFKVKATFFCLGWVAEREPGLLRAIADAGHEVGCHGMDHRRLFEMTDSDFKSDIMLSKEKLEQASGAAVIGYRAPSFSLTPDKWHFYEYLVEAGFRYSSSIVPAKTDHYGLKSAPRRPFFPLEQHAFVEAPLAVAQVGALTAPASGGGYFRLLPQIASKWLMTKAQRQTNTGTIFYMHPWEIDPGQPFLSQAPLKSRFRHYYGQKAMQGKLANLLGSWQFGRLDEMLRRGFQVGF